MRSYHESTDDFLLAQELAEAALLGEPARRTCSAKCCFVASYTRGPWHRTQGTVAERDRVLSRRAIAYVGTRSQRPQAGGAGDARGSSPRVLLRGTTCRRKPATSDTGRSKHLSLGDPLAVMTRADPSWRVQPNRRCGERPRVSRGVDEGRSHGRLCGRSGGAVCGRGTVSHIRRRGRSEARLAW